MGSRVPVGGVFAAIYYEFETGFQVFGSPALDPDYWMNINKMLGHGVKITGWNEKNNVNLIRGLNNIEAATATDGMYEGQLSIEFEAAGNLEWMEALMGLKTLTHNGKVLEYTKKGVPKTLTFLIMIQNDPDNPSGGDIFVMKGVVLQDVTISIEGTNVPVHVKMTCPYASEVAYSSDELPEFFTTTENAFNAGQSTAYFWNPTADVDDMASFDSVETIVESFEMSISHGAELIRGIGSRLARDKYHKYLNYDVNVKSYYRDKERFLEKFYGCREGPINDVIPPMKRVKLVVQNCRSCGDAYRRYEFEFNNVKIDVRDSTIDVEDAITETYQLKPLNCVIRAWNGEEPEAEFNISPEHIKQGDLVAMHGKFFPRDANTNIYVDDALFAAVHVNCSGGFEYRFMADADDWAIGNHTIMAKAYTGSDVNVEGIVEETRTVFVTGDGVNAIPRISICPQLISGTDAKIGPFTISGYNFAVKDEAASANFAIYCPDVNGHRGALVTGIDYSATWVGSHTDGNMLEYISGTIGSFKTGTFAFVPTQEGVYTVTVTEVMADGGSYVCTSPLYVTGVDYVSLGGNSRKITGVGLKPLERCTLYIEYFTGTDGYALPTGEQQYKGAAAADKDGTVEFTVNVISSNWSRLTEIKQSVILADGSGQLVARGDITY